MTRIICWQPVLTPHQSHTLRALADVAGWDIRVVSSAAEIAERRMQGWTVEANLPIEILPERQWQGRINAILNEERDSVHIFGSPFERSKQNLALALALWRGREIYLISEPYSPVATGYLSDGSPWKNRLKAALRPGLYGIYGRLIRRRLGGVFAISPMAVAQYRQMGIDPGHVFPFGYFVPLPPTPMVESDVVHPLQVAYLGSFIHRKGVDTLLEAFARPEVEQTGATLTLFGSGGAKAEGYGSAVRYNGSLPFGAVHNSLAKFDLLVVPSRYDGWAVVVNEGIGAGVPVLASDMVGAGAMLERWRCGERFTSGDVDDLSRRIVTLATDRAKLRDYRAHTSQLAATLQPEIAGQYMYDCINASRNRAALPPALWF